MYPSRYFSGSSPSLSRTALAMARSRFSLSNFRVPAGIFKASWTPFTFKTPYLRRSGSCQGLVNLTGIRLELGKEGSRFNENLVLLNTSREVMINQKYVCTEWDSNPDVPRVTKTYHSANYTECIKDLDSNLVKVARRLFLGQFFSKWKTFLGLV